MIIIDYIIIENSYKKKQWRPPSKKKKRGKYLSPIILLLYGQINSNLEVCIFNFHVYGTVTLAVTVTVNSGASHLQGNHLAPAVRRNQRPTTSPMVSSS
jgi:hypothetical protein